MRVQAQIGQHGRTRGGHSPAYGPPVTFALNDRFS